MGIWRRPYAQSSAVLRREAGAAFAVVAAGLVVAWFAGRGRLDDGRAGTAVIAALLIGIYVVRMRFVGLFFNERGVLIRTFASTMEVPWREVAAIDLYPADEGPGLVAWVLTVHGEQIETPLVRVAAAARTRPVVSVHLPCAVFDQALREVRAAHARVRGR
jgi:hypothetical protein